MSGGDLDHVLGALDNSPHHSSSSRPPSWQSAHHGFYYRHPNTAVNSDPLLDPTAPPAPEALPEKAYHPPQSDIVSAQHPSASAGAPHYAHNNNNNNNSDIHEESGRTSPDPHEYYRPHRVSVAERDMVGQHPAHAAAAGPDDNVTAVAHSRAARVASLSTDLSDLPRPSRPQYRSTSASSYAGRPVVPARPRQISFQDLVNKFNNNSDEILPVPSTSRSRTRSSARSRSPSIQGRRSASRPPSYRREVLESTLRAPAFTRWNSAGVPLKTSSPGRQLDTSARIANEPRFATLPTLDTRFQNPAHGTLHQLRRRGSEGSIASSIPGSLEHYLSQSPLTPTAWYLGHTNLSPEIAGGSGVDISYHRRSRSDDFTANPNAWDQDMAVPQHWGPGAVLGSPSKSRIPLSSSHLGQESASGSVPPPLATTNQTFRTRSSQIPLPPKGTSRLPVPSPKSARVQDAPSVFPIKPVTRRKDVVHGRGHRQPPEKSPLLTAYITAPPPKKSPPLRSSRPRQPVSNAVASSSRSRVSEKVSTLQKQVQSRNTRPRERRVAELGKVDFAMRREKIQQAFNRTVQENARKEERAAQLRRRENTEKERKQGDTSIRPTGPPPTDSSDSNNHRQTEDAATVIDDSGEVLDEKQQANPDNEGVDTNSEDASRLRIDVDIPVGDLDIGTGDDARLAITDSPTLGLADITNREQESTTISHPQSSENPSIDPSDAPPAPPSSVTSGSNDTFVTTFDPDSQAQSQTELPEQDFQPHRTLLSHIMRMRESSPSSSSSDERDYTFSDSDDKESIPILLRETAYPDDSVGDSDHHEYHDFYEPQHQTGDEIPNRWSMSSWSSYIRHQYSVDSRENTQDILPRASSPDESEHASSCSAPSTAPPSVVEDRPTTSHSQPDQLAEQRSQEVVQQNLSGPSLARQGGWDSKRVTQLYLEELARSRGHTLPMPAVRASQEPHFLDIDRPAEERANSLIDDPVVISRFEDVPASERIGHSASLVFRDDWEHASPSIADWMQVAAEDEPAPTEEAYDTAVRHERTPTSHFAVSEAEPSGTEEPETGLGLSINDQPPEEFDSQAICPPPLPMHSPPPPPSQFPPVTAQADDTHAPPLASLPSLPSPPSPPPPPPPPLNAASGHSEEAEGSLAGAEPVHSTDSSENSSLRQLGPASSSQARSSATSLLPPSSEQINIEIKRVSPSPEQRRLKKRRHVIKELIDTECTFGRDMKVVDDIYKGTSSSCLDLSLEDVKVLFANSDQIVHFSMSFQDALKASARSVYVMPRSQRWSSKRSARRDVISTPKDERSAEAEISDLEKDQMTTVGQAFMTHLPQMEKVYADYLKNHDAANKKLQVLQRSPKVAIWLKECREWASDLTSAWDLDSLLVKPVQRILKYPLLLKQLLDATPENHPDHAAILGALEGVTDISVRINEMKKRAELVEQVINRKRKESDVRAGLSKAFGRRTEKLKQQVGLSDMFEDKNYDTLAQRFGDSFFQLQVVMRDVETYTREMQDAMNRFNEFVSAIEGYIDVAQSRYPELESKWRRYKVAVCDVMSAALPDHVSRDPDAIEGRERSL